MATVEEVIVRVTLENLASAPLAKMRSEVVALQGSLDKLGRTTVTPTIRLLNQLQTGSQGAGRGLNGLGREASTLNTVMAQTVRGGANLVNTIGRDMVRASRDGALGLAAMGAAAAVAGLKAASAYDMTQKALSALTGSNATGASLMKFAVTENLRTVYTQADIQRSLQTAIALGMTPGQAKGVLTAGEDLTAATGDLGQLPAVVMALSKVTAGGKLTGREFTQLSSHGIPMAAIVAENTGRTTAQVVDAAHNGNLNVSAADFNSWLQNYQGASLSRLRGLAGDGPNGLNNTLAGQFSTQKDLMLQDLRKGFQPRIPELLAGVRQIGAALDPIMKDIAPKIADITVRLEHFLLRMVPVVGPVLHSFFDGIDKVFSAKYDQSGFLKLGTDLGQSIERFFSSLADKGPSFASSFASFGRVLPAVLDDLTKLLPILDKMATIFTDISSTDIGKQLVALGLTGAIAGHAVNSATGGAFSNVGTTLLLSQLLRRGGGAPGPLGPAGMLTRAGGLAKNVGGAGLILGGGLGIYDTARNAGKGHDSWGGAFGAAASGASIGAGIGAVGGLGVFDEVTIPALAAIGAGLGGGYYGLKHVFGHHAPKAGALAAGGALDNSITINAQGWNLNGTPTDTLKQAQESLRGVTAELARRQGAN